MKPAGAGWLERVAGGILRWRLPILAGAALLTLVLGWQVTGLRFEWDEYAELAPTSPELQHFRRFQTRFNAPEYLLVVLKTDDVFEPGFLAYLQRLAEALRAVPFAEDVVALDSAPVARTAAGNLRIEPFFQDPPATRTEAEALRREALAQPLWIGTLFTADGRTACINVMLPALSSNVKDRLASSVAVREILRRNPRPGVQAFATGISPLTDDMLQLLARDSRRFLWLTAGLVVVFLALAFRTWRGVLAPVLAITAAVLGTLGLLAASGRTLNLCTALLPTLVAINCLSYAIHLLNAYHDSCGRGRDHGKILAATVVHLAPALFMAAITTAIGFGTQMLSELRSLRELGAFSAAGILLAFGLCLATLPAMLACLPLPRRKVHRHRSVRGLRRALWGVSRFVTRDRWRIPALLVVALGVAGAGIARIRVEAQMMRVLPPSMPSIQGLHAVTDTLAGFQVLEVEVSGPPGAFAEPWALAQLEHLQRRMAGLEGVDQTTSINDLLGQVYRVRDPAGAAAGRPLSAGQVAEYRLLFAVAGRERQLDSFVTRDGSGARVAVRIRSLGTAQQLRLAAAVEHLAASELDPRLTVRTTGLVKLFAVTLHALVRSLFKSFGFAFVLIAAAIAIQLRSVKAGLCAMIPNVLPVLLGFGLMGFLGIPLSASTVMIASIGIGIAVDDTIHFLLRFRREFRPGRGRAAAVRRALLGTGRAMVYSSLGLAAGFSILAFSDLRLNREFGLLTAFILLVALVADLYVTPWLAGAFQLFRERRP